MKRIAVVFPNYARGGAETVINALVCALRPRGFDFTLLTSAECPTIADNPFDRTLALDFLSARYDPAITARLAETLRPLSIDVLWIAVDELADLPTLRAALRPGGKIIYHLHGVPFFQAQLKDTYLGDPADSLARKKWFLTKHLREKLLHTYRRRYRRRTALTAAGVDAFVTLCNGYARELAALYPAQSAKFRAIYNPVAPLSTAPCEKKRHEAVFLGRLTHADKRPDLLLRAFALAAPSNPSWTLKIIGDGPERANLETLARELDIADRVCFTGFVSNPGDHVAPASIICLTSVCEGWGMALVEGMQHGLAPIAFNCSAGVAEILAEGRGVLVERFSVTAYAAALARLMSSDTLRSQICATHAPFLQSLSIDNIAPQWQKLLDS